MKAKGNNMDADKQVIELLKNINLFWGDDVITHPYPHCWRCDTPLLNYATDSWSIRVPEKKATLIGENKKVNWIPKHIRDGRFGDWLENTQNWSISRSRFWGAPLPIWESDNGKSIFIDSLAKLKKYMVKSGNEYFFIRHGQAESNVKRIVNSRVGVKNPLTEKGQKQIESTGKKLKDSDIDLIIASPLQRTIETAEIIAKNVGIDKSKIIIDDRLAEIGFGDFEGGPSYPDHFTALRKSFERDGFYGRHFTKGGESYGDIYTRISEFLYDIESKYKGKRIAICSHQAVLRMAFLVSSGYIPKHKNYLLIFREMFGEFGFIRTRNGDILKINFAPLPRNEKREVDLHRPYIDNVVLKDEDGIEYKRVEDVIDCWVESGMMPYSSVHYPFENKKKFNPEKNLGFPADFISEGIDQTRGWFYSLLAVSSIIFGKAPYKNVIVTGLVLGKDGKKLSKSLKNFKDPLEILENYGADSFRYTMLASPLVKGEPFALQERLVEESGRKIIGRLHNCLLFFEQYKDKFDANITYKEILNTGSNLDKWILSRLSETRNSMTESFDSYEIDKATKEISSVY